MSGFDFEVNPTFRDLQGRFARASRQLLEDRRDLMRTLGRRYLDYAREEAPSRSGRFVRSLNYRTFVEGEAIGFRSLMQHPLGDFIILGTRPHTIVARRKQALWWEGARHPVKRVRHPGTPPNPFLGRAYRRWLPGARAELRRIGTRYTRTLASGSEGGTL